MTGRRLLVVEDDQSSRFALQKIFTLRGWNVSAAATLAEALALLEPPPDCVILDLMLPDGPGETLLRAVRGMGLETRVVVATGVGNADRLRDLRGLEPEEIFRKPIDVDDLCRACGDLEPPRTGDDGESASEPPQELYCTRCRFPLDVFQPGLNWPARLLGVCPECSRWHLVDGENGAIVDVLHDFDNEPL